MATASAAIVDSQSAKTTETRGERGYDAGKLIETTRETFGWKLEIVKRSDDVKEFRVLPHRWIVERTFGWLGRYRLFCREHEATVASSRTDIHLAHIA